ncbi:hypothetical protein GCM10027612_81570 [Microbispora bryophytorum subsp. camponoti]
MESRAGLTGQEHERLVRQPREPYGPQGGQRMGGRQHGHEGLGEHRPEGESRPVVGGVVSRGLAQQADVDGLVPQGGDLRRRGHLADVQADAGETLPEVAEQTGQDGQGEGGGEADPQAPGPAAADSPRGGQPVGEIGEGAPGGGQQFATRPGQGDTSRLANEQRVTHLVLQAADLLAERRLGDAQARRGVAEVQLLGEHDEGVQLRQGSSGRSIRTEISGHAGRCIRRIDGRRPSVRRMTERRAILGGSMFEEQIGYARAVVDGDRVHVSGTTGFDYTTMTISENVVEQAEQCLRTIEAALAEAGCGFADVVRVRYLLPDRADFEPCWPILRRRFGEVRPAATMMECGLADPRMKIEIEVDARRPGV